MENLTKTTVHRLRRSLLWPALVMLLPAAALHAGVFRAEMPGFFAALGMASSRVAMAGVTPGMSQAGGDSQKPETTVAQERDQLLNQPWSAEKLYAILSSPDTKTRDDIYRAAFEAGPAIIPRLEEALKDDRTAEFAAQTLAYFGDAKSLQILAGLVNDPRNLDLRRFYYGALGGSSDPRAVEILLNKVRTSDREPDRTVTENAVLALSISSDPGLVAKLRQAENEVTDPVIQDDIETAATVVDLRARYLAAHGGKESARTVEQAIRTYFMPALESAPKPDEAGDQDSKVEVNIRNLTYSPDRLRVLADVDFENPQAVASYKLVLQKGQAGWKIASVWLGEEREKPQPAPQK
ncbi:MAG TPA: HEAT repeat domain-containing protein [Terriglobia bacterium]|nr:HEAT repeat domain-containing protein [Terriglobia bacterium]